MENKYKRALKAKIYQTRTLCHCTFSVNTIMVDLDILKTTMNRQFLTLACCY